MRNIEITVKCIGDPLEALNEVLLISKSVKNTVNLYFESFSIPVRTDSSILDLYDIYLLKNEKS